MDHKLRYRGQIWVIQKHNLKFTTSTTIVMKDTSLNYLFFITENQSKNLDTNSYKGPIWIIQNPNLKFTNLATIVMKDTSPNSLCF